MSDHDCATDDRKLPIDRPCSACSDGDSEMEYHSHCPPFRGESSVILSLSREDYAFLLCALRIARDYMFRQQEDVAGFDRLIERLRERSGVAA